MNDSEYTQGVLSTASRSFTPENVHRLEFRRALTDFINAANRLGVAKKSLFYPGAERFGSDSPEHRLQFRFESFVDPDVLHGMLGVLTEAGEIGERMLAIADNDAILSSHRTNIIEESGDIEWYLALLYYAIGTTSAEVREKNLAKLKARYPNKFSGSSALRRNLDAELRALSSDPKDQGE